MIASFSKSARFLVNKLVLLSLCISFALTLSSTAFAQTTLVFNDSSAQGVDGGSTSIFFNASGFGVTELITEVELSITYEKLDDDGLGTAVCGGVGHQGGTVTNEDISFILIAPDSTPVTLVDFNDYMGGAHGGQVTTIFDDDGAGGVSGTPTSGTFTPNEPLSGFDTLDPDGTWTLVVIDPITPDPLCYVSASLTITAEDLIAPTLDSFTSSTADGTYGPGTAINITANYNEAMGAAATVDVTLTNGETLTLNSVSGSEVSGTYTVGATGSGEDVLDISVQSITAQNGVDLAGNTNSGTALPATNVADGSEINIDTTAPDLLSFTSTTADGTYGPASDINITATYDDTPEPGSTVDVTLNNGEMVTLSTIVGMTITGTYTVGATGSLEDQLNLDVATITSQSVSDPYSNTNSSTLLPATTIVTASTINVDTTTPSLLSFTSTTLDGTYGPTSTINVYSDLR